MVPVIGSRMLQNHDVCWQTELPIAGMADVGIICSSGRTFAERFKKHKKVPSPIHDHYNTVSCNINRQLQHHGREEQNIARTIKEAILIRVKDPTLNRNIGKYQWPHIWDEVLVNSPELKVNSTAMQHFGFMDITFTFMICVDDTAS